jgi:hypothetical protein
MFRPNWPSSGVQVVTVKDSCGHCNAVLFPVILVAPGYVWLCWFPSVLFVSLGCTWLLLCNV